MRYILTEDRIFDLTEIVGYHNIVDAYNEKGEKVFEYLDLNSKGRFKIIKKSDIIDNLLAFTFITINGGEPIPLPTIGGFYYEAGDNCKLYGAIWGKGEHGEPVLHTVAELKDGKWRLL